MKCWELKYASHFAFLYCENELGCCVENIHKIWVESDEYDTNTWIQIEEVADYTNCLKATDCNSNTPSVVFLNECNDWLYLIEAEPTKNRRCLCTLCGGYILLLIKSH